MGIRSLICLLAFTLSAFGQVEGIRVNLTTNRIVGLTTVKVPSAMTFQVETGGTFLAPSVNGLVITTSTGTLTIANGKTATVNNTMTLAGTDGLSYTFPTLIYKTSDTSRTSTTTATADPDLVWTVASGEKYKFILRVYVQTPASTTPDLKYGFNSTATASVIKWSNRVYDAVILGGSGSGANDTFTSAYQADFTSTSTVYVVEIEGSVTFTSSGTAGFHWAQAASSANATTVKAGSTLVIEKF